LLFFQKDSPVAGAYSNPFGSIIPLDRLIFSL
jgi:hypothetical protein